MLIRALGPQLAAFGVDAAVAAPVIRVYDGAGVPIASANGWEPELVATFAAAGASPLSPDSTDAALVLTLSAGDSYTVIVRSADGATGEALLEIYELP